MKEVKSLPRNQNSKKNESEKEANETKQKKSKENPDQLDSNKDSDSDTDICEPLSKCNKFVKIYIPGTSFKYSSSKQKY